MANLNFQQAPRNISNQGLNRGGFNTNSLSGHVTPTSGMFPGSSGINNSFTPQPLSPSRNIPPMANRGLFGQRAFPDRRSIPGLGNSNPMGSMGSFGIPQNRSYGSQGTINNFHSVFSGSGTSGDTGTPPLLDLSEFPSLTNRGQTESMPQPSPMPGKQPYGRPIRAVPNLTKPCPSEPNITLTSKSQEGASSSRQLKSQGKHNRADPNPTKPCPSELTITFKPKSIAVSNPARPRAVVKSSVGMVKQPTAESSEFTMSSEDFPALPGTQRMDVPSPGGSVSAEKNLPGIGGSDLNQDSSGNNRSSNFEKAVKRGIQTSPDGKVTRIPASMVKDQFGMVGLLTFIRAAETDPNLVSLALGQDLTALGLNLNSPENLYPNFGGPWAETPCRPQDIDFHVPPEYLINPSIRDKLGPVKLNRYKDDLLFYMFYTNVGDVAQLAAATELYNREWRYHTEEKVWISQAPGMGIVEKTPTWERGTYYYFDAQNWRKAAKEFHLDYSKLEGRPQMPAAMNQTQNII